jgi:hypothetical protein
MRNAVMAGYAIHWGELTFIQCRRVETRLYIHIFGDAPIIIVDPDVGDPLIQRIGRIVFHRIDNVPVDAASESFAFGATACFQDEINTLFSIMQIVVKPR